MNQTVKNILKWTDCNVTFGGVAGRALAGSMSAEGRSNVVISGYYSTLMAICHNHNIDLDLTYKTMNNFMGAVTLLCAASYEDTTESQKVDTIGRIIGTYAMLLALNMHNLQLKYQDISALLQNSHSACLILNNTLSGVNVNLKNEKTSIAVDFFKVGKLCVANIRKFGKEKYYIQLSYLIEEYKKLTGVDLSQYQLDDLLVQVAPSENK